MANTFHVTSGKCFLAKRLNPYAPCSAAWLPPDLSDKDRLLKAASFTEAQAQQKVDELSKAGYRQLELVRTA
jgi:hypothetical protein